MERNQSCIRNDAAFRDREGDGQKQFKLSFSGQLFLFDFGSAIGEVMTKDELKQYYIDEWKKRKPSGMTHSGAEWDERAVGWMKELKEDPVRRARSDKRVAATVDFLLRHGQLNPEDHVIDIGCGPGQFVTAFAEHAGKVTGTDISSMMCRYGEEFAASQNRSNVDFTVCDFKKTDIRALGWEKRFDLVFSSITPALSDYDSFRRAECMSRAWCFQSNFMKVEDSLSDAVIKEVCDASQMHSRSGLNSLIAMFNILTLEGCMPVVEYYKESYSGTEPVDDSMVHSILKNVIASKEEKEGLRNRIKDVLWKRADDTGCISRTAEWVYGWILWDVRQKKVLE